MGKPHETTASRTGNDPVQEAVALLQRGELAGAERRLIGILADQPGNANAHRTMALLASRTRRQSLALSHMAEACRLAPADAQFHFQLACLQAHAGQLEPALEHFRIVTRCLPDFADGWLFQGLALLQLQRNREALEPLRRAHQLAPTSAKALRALADAEFHGGWPADALPLWRRLLQQAPDDVQAHLRTGETLSRLGSQREAVALYRDGVRRLPASDALWLALAQAEEDNGNRDGARDAYERALALHPNWPFAVACLLGMLRGQAPQALLQQASDLLKTPTLADDDRALVGYALGKARDALGQPDLAMAHWHDANAARRRVAGKPDPDALRRRVDRIIEGFPAAAFPRHEPSPPAATTGSSGTGTGTGTHGDRLVFVVGMPRSGTTLTEQIIASHPRAFGCSELPDMALIARETSADGRSAPPDLQALRTPGALRGAIERYAAAATRHAPTDALCLVDKEPFNFFHLGLIHLMFPRAKVIWCRRDPRDIAVSIYGENLAMDEQLTTHLPDIGHYLNQHLRLMRHWQSVLPMQILESHYEQLVSAQEIQAPRIIEFTGLVWDPACLDFHRNTRAVQSPSRWQVRQPAHTRSVGRWRQYETELAPLFEVLDCQSHPLQDR